MTTPTFTQAQFDDLRVVDRNLSSYRRSDEGYVARMVALVDASGDDIAKREDVAHASGDAGLMALSVRNDTLAALAGADGDYAPLQVDANGAQYVNTMGTTTAPTVTNATGATAIATSTSISGTYRLVSVTVHFNAAPTTTEDLTVTLNANDGAAYDTVLYSVDPSASSATDIVFIPDGDIIFETGDELDVAYANTDTNTYGLRIVTVPA